MSDLLVPSTTLARKADTGDTVKLEAKDIKNARIQDVPNYAAGWLQVGSAAFGLAYEIDKEITTARAETDFNDFRIKMDQYTTDLMVNNKAGLTNEELRAQVFDKMNDYADKNLLGKEYMGNPLIRNKILREYNGYVDNISKTIYADNAAKVQETRFNNASAKLAYAINDATTAYHTSEMDKYLSAAQEAYNEVLEVKGVSRNSEEAKQGWFETTSAIELGATLQNLEDDSQSPYVLDARIRSLKGKMMSPDYVKALRATGAAIEALETKAEASRTKTLNMWKMSIGHGEPQQIDAAAYQLAQEMKQDVAENGEKSRYYNWTDRQINQRALTLVRNSQDMLAKEYDAKTSYIYTTASGVDRFMKTLTPQEQNEIVDYMKSPTADDSDLVLLSWGTNPKYATNKQRQDAMNDIAMNKLASGDDESFNDFSNLKHFVTVDGIAQIPRDLKETDTRLLNSYTETDLLNVTAGLATVDEIQRALGIVDRTVAYSAYNKVQTLRRDQRARDQQARLDGLAQALEARMDSMGYLDKNVNAKADLRGGLKAALNEDMQKQINAGTFNNDAEYFDALISKTKMTEEWVVNFVREYKPNFLIHLKPNYR